MHFIVVIISANNEENFEFWTGHVESKVRKLIKFLDQNDFVEEAHVNLHNQPTYTTHSEDTGKEWHVKKWIIGMKFRKQEGVKRRVTLTPDIRLFKDHVMDPTICPQYDIQNPELYQMTCKYCRHNGIAEHLSEEDAKNIKVSNKKISLDVVNKIDTTPQKPVVKQESPETQEKAPEIKLETPPVKEEPKKPENNNRYHPYKNDSIVLPSTPPSSQSKSTTELIGGEKPNLKISPIKSPQQQKPKEASKIPTVVSSNYNSQGAGFKSGVAPLIKPIQPPQQPQQHNNYQNFNNNGFYPPMGFNNHVQNFLRYQPHQVQRPPVSQYNFYNHLNLLNHMNNHQQQNIHQRYGNQMHGNNGSSTSHHHGNHHQGGRYHLNLLNHMNNHQQQNI